MQQEYFSVDHQLNMNVEVVEPQHCPTDYAQFLSEMPEAFQLSAQIGLKDQNMFNNLRLLGEVGEQLSQYLMRQNQKIEQVLSYVLQQQDESDLRAQSIQIGGSQLSFAWKQNLSIGQLIRTKLFLPEESAAIFCYLKVDSSKMREDTNTDNEVPSFEINCSYQWLREEDQETLVRASLHVQSQQLKLRSQQRQNQNK
ncbi:PilZ domain-containing protein [Alginatibacterium sediminis]|uniref:PilZ domain-containing protein n=1 Tax=Alginatibacterium sediminis TaxID=2164068 RepID=A0A420EFW3_9ALTE|nr:PilZ domain-containing protein [Alginatibacterium sediminis]RKF19544.1 PilZ domain-containing protein [Alginatibacterium sediminis]